MYGCFARKDISYNNVKNKKLLLSRNASAKVIFNLPSNLVNSALEQYAITAAGGTGKGDKISKRLTFWPTSMFYTISLVNSRDNNFSCMGFKTSIEPVFTVHLPL